MTGDHDHLAIWCNPFEPFQYLNAVHPRHPDVEEGDIRFFLLENLNRLLATLCFGDLKTFVLLNTRDRLNHSQLIIHDEDFLGHENLLQDRLAQFPLSQSYSIFNQIKRLLRLQSAYQTISLLVSAYQNITLSG